MTTTPNKPACATCPFWEGDTQPINGIHYGDCRKAAKAGIGWPRTRRDDWCGDHSGFTAWRMATTPLPATDATPSD